ncbi:MAG: lytic transglycosylase domain-containing protein [Magnetococcales bacterium]|nr:lytic transglycosylase domain-containing protein [Magnetococcales bacterium]
MNDPKRATPGKNRTPVPRSGTWRPGSSWVVLMALLGGFGSVSPAVADIYTFTDSNGVIHLTDRPLGPEYRLLISSPKEPKKPKGLAARPQDKRNKSLTTPANSLSASRMIRYDGRNTGPKVVTFGSNTFPQYLSASNRSVAETIHDASMRYQIHSALIKAVIKTESDFNPLAVSPKGAVGLMQLMPGTAQDLGVMDPTDPASNIDGGVRYLRDLLGQFNNNLILSLAAYNAGPGAVKKFGNTVPPYEETQQYVAKVLHFYRAYLGAM